MFIAVTRISKDGTRIRTILNTEFIKALSAEEKRTEVIMIGVGRPIFITTPIAQMEELLNARISHFEEDEDDTQG